MGPRLTKQVLPPRAPLRDPREHWAVEQDRRTRAAIAHAIWTVLVLLALVELLHSVGMWS